MNGKEKSSYENIERARLLRGGGFHIGLYAAKVLKAKQDKILDQLVRNEFASKKLWPNLHGSFIIEDVVDDILLCFEGKKMKLCQRQDVAALARLVDLAAKKGGRWSKRVLESSGRQVSVNIQFVAHHLGISGKPFPVSVFGSVIKSRVVKHEVKSKLFAIEQFVKIQNQLYPPEVGALMIAIKDLY